MSELTALGRVPDWTISDRLRKARESSGLRQQDLADLMGLGRTTLANYETGVTPPKRPVLLAWAMATGVSLVWLEHGIEVTEAPDGGGLPHLDSNQEPADLQTRRLRAVAA